MRRIAVITGTRADYGIYQSVLSNIVSNRELDLSLIVVGMHLSKEFGCTLEEIKCDGFSVAAEIDILHTGDTNLAMAESVGAAVTKIASVLANLKPDILLLLGDRGEMLAGAVAATYLSIPIAHIHGGDISGNVDEPVRHAITKLSHIHFPATKESAQRILKMGEEAWRVHVVGAPGLDYILSNDISSETELLRKYNVDSESPLILMVQHPVVAEAKYAGEQISETLEAIRTLGYQTVIIFPNADTGGRCMIDIIKRYKVYPFIRAFESIPHRDYLGLMKIASVMVGNSSSGIIEAPSFGLPVINIGTRQVGRQRAENVIDVGYNKGEIIKEVQKIISHSYKHKLSSGRLYGDGKSGERIAKILSEVKVDNSLLLKRMTY